MAPVSIGRLEAVTPEAVARSLRAARERRVRPEATASNTVPMARRSYGTGHLYARADKRGRVVWYGQWRVGDTKVKRTIGLKRRGGSREGLTRAQAERELRRRIEAEAVVRPVAARRTVLEVGEDYVDHLEHVMDRKATTIKDYRGYVHGHFEPFFRDRPIDRIDEGWVAAYLKHKRGMGLSAKTVHNT